MSFILVPERLAGTPMTVFEAVKFIATDRFPLMESIRWGTAQRERHVDLAYTLLWMKLASSELHAFVQAPHIGAWYRLPHTYWLREIYDPLASCRIRLPDDLEPGSAPDQVDLHHQPIVFWRDDVRAMMEHTKVQFQELLEAVTVAVPAIGDDGNAREPAPATTSATLLKVERWLLERFSDAGTRALSKGDFLEAATAQFANLSKRAFSQAWANATKEYPERRGAGRKKAS